jgi:hypothetical protein
MAYVCEESLCCSCIHNEVCSKKDTYLAAQEAINNVSVHLKEGSMIDLRNLTWIEKVKLKCKHYYSSTVSNIRGYDGLIVNYAECNTASSTEDSSGLRRNV